MSHAFLVATVEFAEACVGIDNANGYRVESETELIVRLHEATRRARRLALGVATFVGGSYVDVSDG